MLRKKSDAKRALKQFLAMIETQFGPNRIKEWFSDEGGEFISELLEGFTTILKNKGIKVMRSTPYSPQQNGRAE